MFVFLCVWVFFLSLGLFLFLKKNWIPISEFLLFVDCSSTRITKQIGVNQTKMKKKKEKFEFSLFQSFSYSTNFSQSFSFQQPIKWTYVHNFCFHISASFSLLYFHDYSMIYWWFLQIFTIHRMIVVSIWANHFFACHPPFNYPFSFHPFLISSTCHRIQNHSLLNPITVEHQDQNQRSLEYSLFFSSPNSFQRRYSSISGILIRDEDFSTIELGDYGNEPSMPLYLLISSVLFSYW